MTKLTATDARQRWSELLDSVQFKGDRVLVQRNGSDVAAVVSAEDAKLLELIEDRLDLAEVMRRLSDGKEPVPYDKARQSLEL